MLYTCFTLNNSTLQLESSQFLSEEATAFLDECEETVYASWQLSFPSHTSLSPIVNTAILDCLDGMQNVIDSTKIPSYRTLRAFNNAKYSGDTCLNIFRTFKETNGAEIVLYIPSNDFKKKFQFDSTYMTIERFPDYYIDFLQTMEPQRVPLLHFVSLDDLEFSTDVLIRGRKRYLKLENY